MAEALASVIYFAFGKASAVPEKSSSKVMPKSSAIAGSNGKSCRHLSGKGYRLIRVGDKYADPTVGYRGAHGGAGQLGAVVFAAEVGEQNMPGATPGKSRREGSAVVV